MKKWYRLIMSDGDSVRKPFYATELDLDGVQESVLTQGTRITGWSNRAAAMSTSSEDDGDFNDVLFLGIEMLPAFSADMQLELYNAEIGVNDVQYLPIKLHQSSGGMKQGFAIANVTQTRAALDRARCFMLHEDTKIDPLTGLPKITVIGRPAIHAERLSDCDIVRLAEYPTGLLVSDRFAKVFTKHGFTGAMLSPLR